MKLRILSDLHLEFAPLEIKYGGEDILVLAGDIHPEPEETVSFITSYLARNKDVQIILVLGNHDFYDSTLVETLAFYQQLKIPRVYFLHDSSIVMNGIRFFGATLWTDLKHSNINIIADCMNDYKLIKDLTPKISIDLHKKTRKKLEKTLKESKEPVVIITHHLPSYKSVMPEFKLHPLSAAFASNLDKLIPKAKMWIHGHTHRCVNYKIKDTLVICNPRGYIINGIAENPEFNPDLIIEIA